MAHKQRLTDACTSKSDIESLIRKPALCNLVKVFKIKRDTILFLVVGFVPGLHSPGDNHDQRYYQNLQIRHLIRCWVLHHDFFSHLAHQQSEWNPSKQDKLLYLYTTFLWYQLTSFVLQLHHQDKRSDD